MRYIALALIALVYASSPAFGQKGMVGKEFPVLAGEVLAVKNQDAVLVNKSQRRFEYGDTCGTMEDGSLKVLKQLGQDLIVWYLLPSYKETVNKHCPHGVITTTTVRELEEKARAYAQAKEEKFLHLFVPRRDYREE